LKTVKDNVLELLNMAPPAEIQQEVRTRFDRSVEGLALEKSYVRMVRIGRYFYVMTQLIVPSSFRLNRVKELDDIRRRIADGLKDIHPKLVIDSIFTEDEEWTK
jgi:predicted Co/Zn/Cd cation transporter (cation efflux family)